MRLSDMWCNHIKWVMWDPQSKTNFYTKHMHMTIEIDTNRDVNEWFVNNFFRFG